MSTETPPQRKPKLTLSLTRAQKAEIMEAASEFGMSASTYLIRAGKTYGTQMRNRMSRKEAQ
jgi:hypothetical protein